MRPIVLSLPGYEALARRLPGEPGELSVRRFPDGESYVRILTPVRDREVIVVCGLERPDPKVVPLLFALETARELGASRVGLVAEADALHRVPHPHVVRLLDAELAGPQPYLVMERAHKCAAQGFREASPLPVELVASWGVQALCGLSAVHACPGASER
jgi:serine/threonine protein kinase